MKFHCILLFLVSLFGGHEPAFGGLTVIDPTLIAANREASAKQLLELILQEQNQQISIDQFTEFLKRQGSLDQPLAEEAFAALLDLLKNPPQQRTGRESDEQIDDSSIFTASPSPNHQATDQEVTMGDQQIGELTGKLFRAEAAARSSLRRYQDTRDRAIERKAALMKTLEEVTVALSEATTIAEVQKLTGLILSVNTQLMAIENDLTLASQDANARMMENRNEAEVKAKRALEVEKLKFRHAHRRNLELFQITK